MCQSNRRFGPHELCEALFVSRYRPTDYLKIVASLLPKDINLNVRPLDELSDEQLLARLAQLTEMAKPLLAKLKADRDEARLEASRH